MGADRVAAGRRRCARATGLAAVTLIDDSTRPRLAQEGADSTPAEHARGQHLVQIHDMYRAELKRVQALMERVAAGHVDPVALRGMVADLTMRRTYEALGAFCERFCQVVEVHHRIEDAYMFPDLRAASADLGVVLDRLSEEHLVIAELLSELDARVVAMVEDPARLPSVREALQRVADTLLSHLAYEEEQLVGPLGRLGIRI